SQHAFACKHELEAAARAMDDCGGVEQVEQSLLGNQGADAANDWIAGRTEAGGDLWRELRPWRIDSVPEHAQTLLRNAVKLTNALGLLVTHRDQHIGDPP